MSIIEQDYFVYILIKYVELDDLKKIFILNKRVNDIIKRNSSLIIDSNSNPISVLNQNNTLLYLPINLSLFPRFYNDNVPIWIRNIVDPNLTLSAMITNNGVSFDLNSNIIPIIKSITREYQENTNRILPVVLMRIILPFILQGHMGNIPSLEHVENIRNTISDSIIINRIRYNICIEYISFIELVDSFYLELDSSLLSFLYFTRQGIKCPSLLKHGRPNQIIGTMRFTEYLDYIIECLDIAYKYFPDLDYNNWKTYREEIEQLLIDNGLII